MPWDQSSTFSLQRHIGELDWLAPVWLTVTGPAHDFNILPDRNGPRGDQFNPAPAPDPPGHPEFCERRKSTRRDRVPARRPAGAAQFARQLEALSSSPITPPARSSTSRISTAPRSSIISACFARRACVFARARLAYHRRGPGR